MVDVSEKAATLREAVARGEVRMQPATLQLIATGEIPKGDVLAVARLAGIMAAKRTADLIPLCHPLALSHVDVELTPDARGPASRSRAACGTRGPTGVEMEALVAGRGGGADALRHVQGRRSRDDARAIRLVRKSGGRSGTWARRGER
jgi:cyclic pyranopterin phosphate synthase